MQEIKSVGRLGGGNSQSKTVYLVDGLCPTLSASMGPKGNTMPYIVEIIKIEETDITSWKFNEQSQQK